MNIQTRQITPAEAAYMQALEDGSGRDTPSAAWLDARRAAAADRFARLGLPHRRLEEWRWTDLRTALDRAYPPVGRDEAGRPQAIASPLAALDRHLAVFVNGRFRPDLSDLEGLGDGVTVLSLADAVASAPAWLRDNLSEVYPQPDDAVAALNEAFMADGAAIHLEAGARVEKPIELLFVTDGGRPGTVFARNLIVAGPGARALILETHVGTGEVPYVTNVTTEVTLADGADIDHIRLQDDGADAVHLSNLHVRTAKDADYQSFTLSLGARLTRNQGFVHLAGKRGHATVSGSCVLTGRQHCDTALLVDHAVPECTSRELFKCVMDDDSRGVFQGRIVVRQDAQKTDGMQMSRGLLLSERAEFDAKPELEIFADDVRCTHGATSGQIDGNQLFYLRSRGIPEPEARALLIKAFVAEAIDEIPNEDVRAIYMDAVAAKLAAGGDGL